MAGKWRDARLSDFVALQRGHDLTDAQRRPGLIPVMGSAGKNGFHDKARADGPGVVIGRSGASFGMVHYCSVNYWPHNTVLYITDFKGNHPRFVYYLLCSIDFSRYNSGSAQPSLNRNYIYSIPISFPDRPEQKAIADILGAFDDKIELNRKMNETLEEMARAIFKSWFIDFDPVIDNALAAGNPIPNQFAERAAKRKATMDSQLPGLSPETKALFPDSFQDSELGPIPKGWRVGKIAEFGVNHRRGVNPSETLANTPYIGLEHMPRKSIALSDWGDVDKVTSGKFLFKSGEILFGKLRPYFHKVGVAVIDGVCSTDIIVVAPKSQVWFGYLLGHLSSDELIAYTTASSTGTKMPRTKWKDIAQYNVIMPPEIVASSFDGRVQTFVSYIQENIHQASTLTSLRDALLPQLMSGEIAVPVREAAESREEKLRPFAEAVVLTLIVKWLAERHIEATRLRTQKITYFTLRKMGVDATKTFSRQQLGPYNPKMRHRGGESLAIKKEYIRAVSTAEFELGPNESEALGYVHDDQREAVEWTLDYVGESKEDVLELLSTVDYAAIELYDQGKPISVDTVVQYITDQPEWAPKLDKPRFARTKIERALKSLSGRFEFPYKEESA